MSDALPDPLPGRVSETLPLADDAFGPAVATLVRRAEPTLRRAILFLHGFNDYFFHEEFAAVAEAQGWEVYALDLRRYGRSLRDGQLPHACGRLEDYYEEIDEAVARIRPRCDVLVLLGHSTGGLVSSLYAHDRGGVDGLVLNSPFLAFPRPARRITRWLGALGGAWPDAALKLGLPHYGRSLHRSLGPGSPFRGEWVYDREWKRAGGSRFPLGWFRAIHEGHDRVAAGLEVPCPVLLLHSSRSGGGPLWNESYTRSDVVLDVRDMVRLGPGLGADVTLSAVEDGLHDLLLSAPAVRQGVYDTLFGWLAPIAGGRDAITRR